jgi:hypothetical protein
MSLDRKEDSNEHVKSWMVEWGKIIEEFEDYSKALELFNSKSSEDVILYEVQRTLSDGSIVKKIPILNTKKSRKRMEELDKKRQKEIQNLKKEEQIKKQNDVPQKNRIQDIKYRIIFLIVVVIAFFILLYILSQLVASSDTLHSHVLGYEIKTIQSNIVEY